MGDHQGWNAIVPGDVTRIEDWRAGLNLPAGSQVQLVYTNHKDANGNPLPFNTANGLVAPSGEWHVDKPLTAFQDQLQLRKNVGPHTFTAGLYFANYTQGNHWYFTDILMDVRDNPRFLDAIVTTAGQTTPLTKNGFRNFVSLYVNGSGQSTIFSGMLGASVELAPRLRLDGGIRYEYDYFVQSGENTSPVDLDGDPTTKYDIENWGNDSFRHFQRSMDDFAASLGFNYGLSDRLSIYAVGARAYKMPALDEFLNAQADLQVALFEPQRNWQIEGGVKYAVRRVGFAVNGFYTTLKNIVSQGAVTNQQTGGIEWIIQTNPETQSYGAEFELSAIPVPGLTALLNGTVLKADYAKCPEPTETSNPCPTGSDVGTLLNGVPPVIGNLSLSYDIGGVTLLGDTHYVARRYSSFTVDNKRNELPAYAYANFGVSYAIPNRSMVLSLDMMNAFQSKGLEEGNPRLSLIGGRTSDLFLARPLLPRRFMVSLRYDF